MISRQTASRLAIYLGAISLMFAALYGSCGGFHSAPTLTGLRVERVGQDRLRLDFASYPELVTDNRVAVFWFRLCGAEGSQYAGSISVGNKTRWEARDDYLANPKARQKLTYSGYIPIFNARFDGNGVESYNLLHEPRAVCAFLKLGGDYQVWHDTNEIKFTAEQVAAALREEP